MADAALHLSDPPLDDRVFDEPGAGGRLPGGRVKPIGGAKKRPGAAVSAPLAEDADASPALPSWRVYYIAPSGERVYIGAIGTHSTPEHLIARFPSAMPPRGAFYRFTLIGVDQEGVDTDQVRTFNLSGDSPDVIAARAGAAPHERAGSAEQQAMESLKTMIQDERAELARIRDALTIERRTIADHAAHNQKAAHDGQVAWIQATSVSERQRHETQMSEERERRADDRKDREEERKEARAAAAERARIDAEDRKEERAERARLEAIERQDRRDHELKMSTLAQNGGIAKTLESWGPIIAAIGAFVPVKDIVARALGTGDEGAVSEQLGVAIAKVVETTVKTGGDLAKHHLDNQTRMVEIQAQSQAAAARAAGGPQAAALRQAFVPAAAPQRAIAQAAVTSTPKKADVTPAAASTPSTSTTPAAPPAPAAAPPDPQKLAGVPLAVQRKARNAIRAVLERLRAEPNEAEHKAIIMGAMFRFPAIGAYVDAVGLPAAVTEAGATPGELARLLAAVNPTGA